MATAWIRKLKITLMSETSHKQIIFGDSAEYARLTNAYAEDPTIKVTGTKYLSPLKDEFVVYIKNVPMQADDTIADVASVSEIKEGNYRYITIESGYQDASMVIFNGYIVFISSKREEANKTISLILTCSGSYMYNNLNSLYFTVKKGTSYYSALTFAARRSGLSAKQVSIDSALKHRFLQQDTTYDGTLTSILTELNTSDHKILCHNDLTSSGKFTIWDGSLVSKRTIHLTKENIILSNGFPTVNKEGIEFEILPFFNFIPGDEVILDDKTFIDEVITSLSSYEQMPSPHQYVDSEGKYIIKELSYNLENRGDSFSLTLKCYSKANYSKFTS
jgi:hypothetical protein